MYKMVTKLRLEIYRITLQKKVKGKNGETWENCNYVEFLNQFDSDKTKALPTLWTKFVEYFQNGFLLNKNGDRAITATEECKHAFDSNKNIINGEVDGGPTNREQRIFKQKDSKRTKGKVDDDDVVTSRFFVKFWLPVDYSTGALMIQSYTTSNISELVRVHFTKFVRSMGFRILPTSYYPKSFMDERNKHSNVISVSYVQDKLSKNSRKLINPLFADFEDLKVKIVVTGFRKSVNEFWPRFTKSGKTLNTDIDALDLKADDDNKIVAVYEDEEGRTTTMNIDQKRLRNFAYYILPEEIMLTGKNTYDFNEISQHTNSILLTMQEEIGYRKMKKDA